ncbi:purple acid phosphatase-like protein, partial [Trifolium medium]|nr:purple acid phosphatase-like protein [Trifolium medium]
AVIISWVTPDEPGSSRVQFGTSEDKFQASAEGTVSNYTFGEYKSGYIHHCLVEGLEHNTKYYYRIGSGDSSREFWFETPPKVEADAPYKFGIIGISTLMLVYGGIHGPDLLRRVQHISHGYGLQEIMK